jgi:hypothetical protein
VCECVCVTVGGQLCVRVCMSECVLVFSHACLLACLAACLPICPHGSVLVESCMRIHHMSRGSQHPMDSRQTDLFGSVV